MRGISGHSGLEPARRSPMVSEGSTSGVSLMPTVHLGSLKPERTKHGKRTLDMLDVCVCVCV